MYPVDPTVTLADAVASTFKVPFVRVQVFVPGGGALAASHGVRTTDAQEVDIAYRGLTARAIAKVIAGEPGYASVEDRLIALDAAMVLRRVSGSLDP